MDSKLGMRMNLAPERRLMMTFALRQSLEILQMPQLELASWLKSQIEQNPLLEIDPRETRPSKFRLEEGIQIASPSSLQEHLMKQVRESFPDEKDRSIAKRLLLHLDDRGYLAPSYAETARGCGTSISSIERILSVLQTFDPPGICARNLQECLLLQLAALGKKSSQAFQIIDECFDDLLRGRFKQIQNHLKTQDLSDSLKLLSRLYFRPIDQLQYEPAPWAIPDIQIQKQGENWTVELDESELPNFEIKTCYLSLIPETPEEKEALRLFKASAKWLIRSLSRRKTVLYNAARLLVRKQQAYLDGSGPLAALSLKDLSESLQIHESTLSRALSGKYAETPRGLIPLRSLITSFPETDSAKNHLEKMIAGEDKQNPLTDEELAKNLLLNGFDIARRTVAKYRKQLKIGSASRRKTFRDSL